LWTVGDRAVQCPQGDLYLHGQPDCVPPGGDSWPADEFPVVRRFTEPTVFVESARARSL